MARGVHPLPVQPNVNLWTLAEVIDGNCRNKGFNGDQVSALVRYIAGDAEALADYPEVLRLVTGAQDREVREARHLERCGCLGSPCTLCGSTWTEVVLPHARDALWHSQLCHACRRGFS